MDQFKVLLQAVLDANSIGQQDINKIQKSIEKYAINITTQVDEAKAIAEIKKIVPELQKYLSKSLGVDIKINDADLLKAYKQMQLEAERTAKIQKKAEQQAQLEAERTAKAQEKASQQAAKSQENLINQMAKVREKSELIRQAEEKRNQSSQANAINKSLEQEYVQREKILAKIKEAQTTGELQTKLDTATASYVGLDKLGIVTDKLKTDFTQLKLLHESFCNSTSDNELISNYRKFDTLLQTVNNSVKQINLTELSSLKTAQLQTNYDSKRSLSVQKISTYLQENSKLLSESKKTTSANYEEAKKWYNEIVRIQDAMRNLDTSDLSTQNKFKVLTQQLSFAKSKVKELGLEGRSTIEEMKNMFQKFSGWFGVSQMVMLAINKFRDAIVELKEIDTILTEISKTADVTAEQLSKIGDNSFETASKYGVKATNYLTGIQEMSRAGYGNSEDLAELSVLAQSAGDMTDDLANKYIIATDAAYKLGGETSKLNGILDGQNFITNKNALNMSDLAEATKVAASQAAGSGVEVDKLTSAIGTMIATTQQGGDVAGRAFKGILMNIQQVKGETEDGEIIDDEKLKKVEATCKSVGIELKEVKNGIVMLRDPMEVLKELSETYRSMDKMDARRSQIIGDIGGKYRGNQLSALLEGWDMYEKMLSEYSQGSGSAFEEAMKSANNWEGSLNRLSNTWTDTIENIADSKGITTSINSLNGLLEIVNSITSALGGLGTIGAIGGGILGAKTSLDYRKYDITQILQGSGKSYCYG